MYCAENQREEYLNKFLSAIHMISYMTRGFIGSLSGLIYIDDSDKDTLNNLMNFFTSLYTDSQFNASALMTDSGLIYIIRTYFPPEEDPTLDDGNISAISDGESDGESDLKNGGDNFTNITYPADVKTYNDWNTYQTTF
jgi:hypothetical protein